MKFDEDTDFPIDVFVGNVGGSGLYKFLVTPVKAWFTDAINDFPELRVRADDGFEFYTIREVKDWYNKWFSQFEGLKDD